MNEEALDVRRVLRVLGRRWLLILAFVVGGAAAGLGVAVVQSPTFVARSEVLLPPSRVDTLGNPERNMQTEQQIAGSAEILSRAGQAFSPPLSVKSLRRRVKVVALTPDIIEVRAEAASGRDAASLADRVADAYVGFSNDATAEVATTTLAGLQSQATDLDQHIRQLNADIADNTARMATMVPQSPEVLRQAAIIDAQRLELTDTARELSNVNTKIADARLNADLLRRGTRLLQPALVPRRPATPRPVVNTAIGSIAGLVLVVLGVLLRGRDRRRVTRRHDISQVVGAPVLLSLTVPRRDGVDDYQELLENWEPSLAERWSIRQAFAQLGIGDQPTNLAIVTMAGDVAGPPLALLVAMSAASEGMSTALVVDTQHPDATSLRAACNVNRARGGVTTGDLSLHTAVTKRNGKDPFHGRQLTVNLAVADAGPVRFPTLGRQTVTLMALSSGFATADQLAAAAVRCFDAGHPVVGVLVANPDPADRTTGRVPPVAPPLTGLTDPPEPARNGVTSVARPVR